MKKRSDAPTGAPAQADVSDPYIQELASAALAEVDRKSNALYRQKVVRIVEAQKQVISMYFFKCHVYTSPKISTLLMYFRSVYCSDVV